MTSGWIPCRTQKRTAPCAVARKASAIGRREVGWYSDAPMPDEVRGCIWRNQYVNTPETNGSEPTVSRFVGRAGEMFAHQLMALRRTSNIFLPVSGCWQINLPGARRWGPSSPKAISRVVQASQFQRTAAGNWWTYRASLPARCRLRRVHPAEW